MSSLNSTALLVAVLLSLAWFAPAAAEPYIPTDDAQVLERLPLRPADPALQETRRLRRELASEPDNLQLALRLARRYYVLSLGDGDPRYVGYAQAALGPWWDADDAPVEALVMRATVRQYLHDFPGALADLDRALDREPGNGNARFQRAIIRIVQADYAAARQDCEQLGGQPSPIMALGCTATVDALAGRAPAAHRRLSDALAATPDATPTQRLWVLTRLGEIAYRLGRNAEADRHFRDALALGIPDNYLLATYAEFLLDQRRHREVTELLRGQERSDVLLVRLALAEKALGLDSAAAHAAVIRARFDAARLRGDKLHIQDEARFTLEFLGRPAEALELAMENYRTQREPSDARMLLEAALAASDARAARPALQWLEATGHEDVYIRRVAEQLKALTR